MAADEEPGALTALLEEYKLQRVAVADKAKTAQHTITFGGATIGILVAGGFNVWSETLPATLIFLVAIPLISGAVFVQWGGQMLSLGRTHRYIHLLEGAILTLLRSKGPVPEALFVKRTHQSARWYMPDYRWLENAAIPAVFGLIALLSLVLGAYKGYDDYKLLVVVAAAAEAVALLVTALLVLWALGPPKIAVSEAGGTSGPPPTTTRVDRAHHT